MAALPEIVVANFNRRYTGVSATVAALVPQQRKARAVAVVDRGDLNLGEEWTLAEVARAGRTPLPCGRPRIWHARRDSEMWAGLYLKHVRRQNWRLVFTSAAPRRHGRVLRMLIGRMDAIVATSPRSAGFLDWHSAIVPHGVDTDLFHPAENRAAALAEVGLGGRRLIGVFGRIRPSKGTDLVVDALVRLLPGFPDWDAVFTGLATQAHRDYADGLRRKIAAAGLAGRIRFLGDLPMPQVRRWYQRIHLCVAASRREGFGLTPLEAFASGAPAITSRAGAWPWIVTDEVGATFKTGDMESLAAALLPILDDPARLDEMGRRARAAAVRRHSIAGEAAGIDAVYRALQAGALPRLPPP